MAGAAETFERTVAVLRSWEPEQLPRASDDLQEPGVLLDRMAREVDAAAGEMTWRSLIGYYRQMGALRDQAGRLGRVSHIDRI